MKQKSYLDVTPAKRKAPIHPEPKALVKRAKIQNVRPSRPLQAFVCGGGEMGELGLGTSRYQGQSPVEAKVPRMNHLLDVHKVGVVQIAVGGMHTAALTHDSKVLTWGVNDDWALGRDAKAVVGEDDSDDDEFGLTPGECQPLAVPSDSFPEHDLQFSQVAATDCATFALTTDGRVYGWGTFKGAEGDFGFFEKDILKKPSEYHQKTPALIPGLANVTQLAASSNHMLALDSSQHVWAWGYDQQGQLGHRTPARRKYDCLLPYRHGLKDIVKVSCGLYHSFAIDKHGRVYAWGLNNWAQTGIPSGAGGLNAIIEKPTLVKSLREYRIREISGGNHHSIACTEEGEVLTWGRCDDAQVGIPLDKLPKEHLLLGENQRPRILLNPSKVPDLKATSVAAGIDDSFAISPNGQVHSWGFSENYRTGLKTEDSVIQPTLIKSKAVEGKIINFVESGGQFLVLAGEDLCLSTRPKTK